MASISGVCSPSSAVRIRRSLPVSTSGHLRRLRPFRSVADLNRSFSSTSSCSSSSASLPVEKVEDGSVEKDPINLWNRYVDWLYQHKELGLLLDVSRIGFTDKFFDLMEPRLQKALVAMQDLEKGAIANPDEGRMVGHYWLRKSKLAPNSFLRLQIDNTLDAICKFADDVISAKIKPPSSPAGRFTQVLSVGIGGSSLGPQFVAEALAPDNPPLKGLSYALQRVLLGGKKDGEETEGGRPGAQIRFIDNTDPAGIDHQIAQLGPELASTLVIVISKSGGTPETRNGLLEVQKAFREAGLEFSKQGVAITQENSLLDNTARIEGWLARFPMFDWVGGRTSEMSAVGLLPAALQGIDIKEMLVGASLMDEATRMRVIKDNPAALLALCWYWASDGIGSKDMVVLPYKDSLLLFSRYLQQLVMESLGKEFDLDGNRVCSISYFVDGADSAASGAVSVAIQFDVDFIGDWSSPRADFIGLSRFDVLVAHAWLGQLLALVAHADWFDGFMLHVIAFVFSFCTSYLATLDALHVISFQDYFFYDWFLMDLIQVNQGLSVYGNKGSTDQHAYIQQLREGVHNFFVTFIEVLRDRPPGHDWELEPGVTCGDYLFGMLQGTRSALYANDRESITVTVQEVTPRSVGALIALYERAVGIYAHLVNINAYHQPGVEAGKKAAGEVLALQKRILTVLNEASCKQPVEPLSLEEIADRCHIPEEIEMIYKIIAHMAANDRALIAEGSCGSPRSIKVYLGECNVDDLLA
ncbi:hypothetical protein ZIOFF_049972 [Zingiber officinale]|uniref:Glucose-6-phosphate isomerase n=1 Tax=Zingiber officinale TaxID=94328 RepID=A0A8J5FKH3_ZINOF|nr:hypothetical protein ZIOFF_049972 [Zingiber officinale]